MADRKGKNYRTQQQAGHYGNASVAVFKDEFAADAAGTVLQLGKLPGGSRIFRVTAKNADMGDAQTMDVGYRYLNPADGTSDPDAFFDGIAAGTAAAVNEFVGAIDIAEGEGVEIVAQNIGAAATGEIICIVEYVYNGQ
tara:strand:+ start:37724 stop:38140 length:417 start_codon:yes stop_codon:yes gene_type:complete